MRRITTQHHKLAMSIHWSLNADAGVAFIILSYAHESTLPASSKWLAFYA
jgi:hypothetical protein